MRPFSRLWAVIAFALLTIFATFLLTIYLAYNGQVTPELLALYQRQNNPVLKGGLRTLLDAQQPPARLKESHGTVKSWVSQYDLLKIDAANGTAYLKLDQTTVVRPEFDSLGKPTAAQPVSLSAQTASKSEWEAVFCVGDTVLVNLNPDQQPARPSFEHPLKPASISIISRNCQP